MLRKTNTKFTVDAENNISQFLDVLVSQNYISFGTDTRVYCKLIYTRHYTNNLLIICIKLTKVSSNFTK